MYLIKVDEKTFFVLENPEIFSCEIIKMILENNKDEYGYKKVVQYFLDRNKTKIAEDIFIKVVYYSINENGFVECLGEVFNNIEEFSEKILNEKRLAILKEQIRIFELGKNGINAQSKLKRFNKKIEKLELLLKDLN